MTDETDEVEHGVESAHYSNGPLGFRPQLLCVCGFATSGGCENWEEAGSEFDHHLAQEAAQ